MRRSTFTAACLELVLFYSPRNAYQHISKSIIWRYWCRDEIWSGLHAENNPRSRLLPVPAERGIPPGSHPARTDTSPRALEHFRFQRHRRRNPVAGSSLNRRVQASSPLWHVVWQYGPHATGHALLLDSYLHPRDVRPVPICLHFILLVLKQIITG